MKQQTSHLSALTRLFSSAVFRELAAKGRSAQFRRLVDQAGLDQECDKKDSVGDAFEKAFAILRVAGQRDEYVYRAALIHKILLGRHSLQTASVLNEFRVGACKADLVVLNGTATVYEIKSERDSLSRLANQIEHYQRVFATVNVIASESHVDAVLATVPDDVGVMCLSRRQQISTKRPARDRAERICPTTVLSSLRAAEAIAILKALNVVVPEVPNTRRYALLRELFEGLDPSQLHFQMVRTLKRTRSLAPMGSLVDRLPRSLHAAALSIPLRRANHDRLVEAVGTPLSATVQWT